jgi:hypothetical protein
VLIVEESAADAEQVSQIGRHGHGSIGTEHHDVDHRTSSGFFPVDLAIETDADPLLAGDLRELPAHGSPEELHDQLVFRLDGSGLIHQDTVALLVVLGKGGTVAIAEAVVLLADERQLIHDEIRQAPETLGVVAGRTDHGLTFFDLAFRPFDRIRIDVLAFFRQFLQDIHLVLLDSPERGNYTLMVQNVDQ